MKNRLLLLTLSLCLSIASYSQDDLPNFKTLQIGVQFGGSTIGGDVLSGFGSDIGLHATKSFNEFLAIRSTLSFNQSKGVGFWPDQITPANNPVLSELGYSHFVKNYSTKLVDFTIEPMLTARHSNLTVYIGAGPSLHLYSVHYNALDENGDLYDFSLLTEAINQRGDLDRSDKEIVKDILDDSYETNQLTDNSSNRNTAFGLSFRIATTYAVNSRLSLGIDSRLLFSSKDNLDGFITIDDVFIQNDQALSFSILGTYTIGK